MIKFVQFDYCALIVEALIIVSIMIRKMTRGRVNKWALVLILDIVVATIADTAATLLEVRSSSDVFAKYIANTFTLWGTTMTSVLFCGYLLAVIGVWHKIHERRILSCVYIVPIIVMTLLIFVVNPFTKTIFYIDSEGIYQRGAWFYVLYAMSYVYIFVGYAEVIRYRKLFDARKMLSIILVFVMNVFASVVQALYPQYTIQMFFSAASFLVAVFGVQTPEERMHGATGLFSMNAFVQDINKYRALDTPIGVTLSVMTNYNALVEMFGYFTVQAIIIDISGRLERWAKMNRVDAEIYYLGGGRFAVIVDDRYEKRMLTISQEVNAVLTEDVQVGEMQVKVMNNVCFIACPKDIDDPDFLFSFDGRLEEEIYSGELRYAEKIFDKKRFELRRDIAKVIDRAFVDKSFRLEFQPIYSVKDKRFVRAEAFLRLNDPEFGNIAPDLLISEAEKCNSIHAITTFVVEEVCKFISMSEYLLLGFEFVEINLSPVQCMWSELLPVTLSTVGHYNVQPKSICFNITDVDSQDLFDRMSDNLEALSQVGFGIMMDDFGAGIFEVERIAKMPLSGIKLDRHFVREGLKPENTAVFDGTLRMIEDLDIDSVAVGVEDDEMEDKLIKLGCGYLQGYHFCMPLDKKELIRFILMG